jgi:hypothetical protein
MPAEVVSHTLTSATDSIGRSIRFRQLQRHPPFDADQLSFSRRYSRPVDPS